jgi:acetyltransferase-like isoleucine patch superfamily enzyme
VQFAERERYIRRILGIPRKAAQHVQAVWHLRHCDELGALARCSGKPNLNNGGTIRIGNYFSIENSYVPVEITCHQDAHIEIGSRVEVNYGVLISAQKRIRIGNNVMVGNLSVISDSRFPRNIGQTAPCDDECLPIDIGDDVWLGVRVTVLPGSTIGRGTVIAANSIVSGDIPAGIVAMGNPARRLMPLRAPPDGQPIHSPVPDQSGDGHDVLRGLVTQGGGSAPR